MVPKMVMFLCQMSRDPIAKKNRMSLAALAKSRHSESGGAP
jgi:hypothetical protein